jgi:hypothetical protein
MRSRFLIAVTLLFSALIMTAGEAEAKVYWSSIATACTPDSTAIQNDRYTTTPDSTISPAAKAHDPIVLICAVPQKEAAEEPDTLSMTYLDSTGKGPNAKVQAQLIRVNRNSGARRVAATVSSNDATATTIAYRKSGAFAQALNFIAFYYYIRIEIDRSAASDNVKSLGVALESSPPPPLAIASFGPALSYARAGTTNNAPTFPQPLTVTLNRPAPSDTTVAIVSTGPSSLTASNVTISAGATSAVVPVTAVAQDASVGVSAKLNDQTVPASVRVLGATEEPTSVTLTPGSASIPPNGHATFTVKLDVPALFASNVTLNVTPSSAGTLPATVTIAADQTSANFSYTHIDAITATITATFGSSTSSATVQSQ